MKETLKMEDIVVLLETAFAAGESFVLYPRGSSMLPLIRQGRDAVRLVPPSIRPPRAGDILLYRRPDGHYVLHRLIRVRQDGFVMCGDHQTQMEYGVAPASVIAVAEAVLRDDVWWDCEDASYKRYVRRRPWGRLYRRLKDGVRRIFKVKKAKE